MKVKYSLYISPTCPVDKKNDRYLCEIYSDRATPVEKILEVVEDANCLEAYQEQITDFIARRLGCEVKTLGYHSGIKTECVCDDLSLWHKL